MTDVYNINCASIRGKSHLDKKIQCQDSSLVWSKGNKAIVIVSDGHSEKKKSDVGSKIAVEESLRIISKTINKPSFMNSLNDSHIVEAIKDEIIDSWKSRVDELIKDGIRNNRNKRDIEISESQLEKEREEYGATLVTGFMVDDYIFGIQIGDGDYYAIENTGYVHSNLMPPDPDSVGSYTHSLCDLDAKDKARTFIKKSKFVAICVSTDGMIKSFDDVECGASFIRLLTSYMDVKNGWANFAIEKIHNLALNGIDGDDVSVSIASRKDANYLLFESLSTKTVPELKHGGSVFMTLKKRHDGYMSDKEIVEIGSECIDTMYYEGQFVKCLLEGLNNKMVIMEPDSKMRIDRGELVNIVGLTWIGPTLGSRPDYDGRSGKCGSFYARCRGNVIEFAHPMKKQIESWQ